MCLMSCTPQRRSHTLALCNFFDPLSPSQPLANSLLQFRVLPGPRKNVLEYFGAGEEDIIHSHGFQMFLDDCLRIFLLKSFADIVESVPTATFIMIEEARPETASSEGAEVDPFVTVILTLFIIAVNTTPCCTRS